jgi:cell division initiation protein
MRITPLDIRKQEFRKGMRGLDPEEVYAFLSTVADEYESILNDNKALRERLLELDDKVQEYRTMEKTLRDTLLTAERVNAEAKDNARREANIIIKEAQIEAEKALGDIKTEAVRLHQQVQQLRSQRDAYLARMKVVAESHLSTIESALADFERDDDTVDVELADEPAEREDAAKALFDRAPQPHQPKPAPSPEPPVSSGSRPAPAPAPAPSSPRPPSDDAVKGLSQGSVDPISVIIDRMKKGQLETLSSGAGTPGAAEPSPPLQAKPDAPETAAPAGTAVAPPREKAPDDVEETSEFNLDEIRREVGAEDKGQR